MQEALQPFAATTSAVLEAFIMKLLCCHRKLFFCHILPQYPPEILMISGNEPCDRRNNGNSRSAWGGTTCSPFESAKPPAWWCRLQCQPLSSKKGETLWDLQTLWASQDSGKTTMRLALFQGKHWTSRLKEKEVDWCRFESILRVFWLAVMWMRLAD